MSLLLLFNKAAGGAAPSTPALVQTAKGNGGGYVTSYTLAFASPVTAGSLLVMSITADAATVVNTITDTRGNTWKLAGKTTGTNRNSRLYYVENAVAGTTTVTIPTGDFNDSATIMREYSGMALSAALDAVTIASDSGYTTTHTSGNTGATTQASELVIATFSGDDVNSVWTAGTGYGHAVTQGGGDLYMTNGMEDKVVSATGPQSASMTSSSSTLGDSIIATFKAAGGTTTTYTSPTTGVPGASGQANWYPYGYAPSSVLATRLTFMQNSWTQDVSYTFTQSGMPAGMPTGAWRVKVPDQNDPVTNLPNGTFSEGIGYGMLGAVWMGNPTNPKFDSLAKSYFDGFWTYYTFFKNANGLMNWRIDHQGNVTGTGGATDADADVAMALVLASRLWGNGGAINYGAAATALINAIATYEVYPANHSNAAIRNLLINGDGWDATQSGSPDWAMPDYFAPAWYREFYAHTGNARWLDIINAGYAWIGTYFDTPYNTGMLPDNATRSGGQPVSQQGYKFSYNAIRYPWRMAADYLWNGTNTNPLAYYFPKKLADFTNTQAAGVASAAKADWNIDGSGNGGYINDAFIQAYAAATLVSSTTSAWGASLYAYADANNTSAYFGNNLVLMSNILAAGQASTTFTATAVSASATLAATSSATIAAIRSTTAAAVIAASAVMTGSAFGTTSGAATVPATSTMTATSAGVTSTAGSTLNATSGMTAAGTVAVPASASAAGASTLTATVINKASGASNLAATSSMTAAGNVASVNGVSMSATSSMTAAAVATYQVSASMAATSSMTAAGSTFAILNAGATVNATSSATAAASATTLPSTSAAGTSTATATATAGRTGASTLAATSSMSGNATLVLNGASAASGTSTMTAAGALSRSAAAALTASSSMTAGAQQKLSIAAVMVGTSSLVASANSMADTPTFDGTLTFLTPDVTALHLVTTTLDTLSLVTPDTGTIALQTPLTTSITLTTPLAGPLVLTSPDE